MEQDFSVAPSENVEPPVTAPLEPSRVTQIVPPLPTKFRRAAVRKTKNWGLPRSFIGFMAADPGVLSVRGAAPKCILVDEADHHVWFMAKASEMWGVQETYTEFFISQLGERLGFPMAHNGLARVDGEIRFISKSFLGTGEKLVHGSIMLESFFSYDLANVGKNPWDEQRTYDIDILDELIRHFCGDDAERVLQGLVEMLIFDALIGSNDRHMQNWGVITTATEPQAYRFAPIFDSARALLWDYNENRLEKLSRNKHAMEGYANRARPKIGCAKFGKTVNHFELFGYLIGKYRAYSSDPITRVTPEKLTAASKIMREYPFRGVFTPLRQLTVTNILRIRAEQLAQIAAEKGQAYA